MSIEKFITPFIEAQFPQFYQEEGPLFIEFVKAYYEWLEQSDNITNQTRSLMEYRDLDTTTTAFIKYFKNKYINSLPENIVADKTLLMKHILDLYRSKGTERSYSLLFRMLFNEDIEIYVPGKYIFKPSDNEWVLPKYIEVSDSPYLFDFIGKKIYSSSFNSTAIVENYFTRQVNNKLVNVLSLSNIEGRFKYGEKILSEQLPEITSDNAPVIFGSLSSVGVYEGGLNYSVGDVLNISGTGKGGLARVVSTRSKNGEVTFNLLDGGSGFSLNAIVHVDGAALSVSDASNTDPVIVQTSNSHGLTSGKSVRIDLIEGMDELNTGSYEYYVNVVTSNTFQLYHNSTLSNTVDGTTFGAYVPNTGYVYINTGGENANFQIGSIVNKEILRINTDTISDYEAAILDSTVSGFDINVLNILGTFTIGHAVSMANVNVRGIDANILSSSILTVGENLSNSSYGISNLTVTISDGSYIQFKGSDVNNANLGVGIHLTSNTSNTVFTINALYDIEIVNATATITSSNSSVIGVNNQVGYFIYGEKLINNTVVANADIGVVSRKTNWMFDKVAIPDIENLDTLIGNALTTYDLEVGTIASLKNINSGEGYASDPVVTITEPLVYSLKLDDGQSGFKGFNAVVNASAGFANGIVTAIEIIDSGFGYTKDSTVFLNTSNNQYSVIGTSVVDLNGIGKGYWKDNRSFTSDKIFLQDSFYYQNYSYEIMASRMLETYEKFVMDLIHPTGMKLFGKYLIRNELVNDEITLESSTIFPDRNFFTVDTDIFTSDRDGITVDLYNDVEYTADSSTLLSDNSTFTVDKLFS
jgi:hypothetical protein